MAAFRFTVPEELAGKPLYIYPRFGSYEALLYVNGMPFGNFAYKIAEVDHGNHYCDLLRLEPKAGEVIDIVIEAYAGHHVIGTQPFETNPVPSYRYTFESIDICTKNQDIADFIYDLRCLNQLAEVMDEKSFRRADVINCLAKVHETVYYSPEHTDEAVWRPALARAREIMRPCLKAKNAESAPKVGLVGHSHMDTAWLWDIPKTIKKCARTYANQLALMEEYPEYRFIQSSAFHLELIRIDGTSVPLGTALYTGAFRLSLGLLLAAGHLRLQRGNPADYEGLRRKLFFDHQAFLERHK